MLRAHPTIARHANALKLLTLVVILGAALLAPASRAQSAPATNSTEILPLSQVRAGMKGYAFTIFAGDQVEKFDLEVIGVLDNFLGPGQAIILVQLLGPKVEHTGVVAGMSGSPVYLEGKLAGALSLKLGIFTKEAIAGVTPIEDALGQRGAASPRAIPFPPARRSSPSPRHLSFPGFSPPRSRSSRRRSRVTVSLQLRAARSLSAP